MITFATWIRPIEKALATRAARRLTPSTILGALESVAGKLQDGDLDANDIYLIRLMIGAAQSLINASTFPVEFGNREGGPK